MIIIVCYENFPNGSPGAIRVNSFAQAYVKFGYEVAIIHKGEYVSYGAPEVYSCYHKNKYKKFFSFSDSAINTIEKIRASQNVEAVISYGLFEKIHKWCNKNKIPFIVDVVEWYSKEQFPRWYLSLGYHMKQHEIKTIARKKINVIAISSYLQNYFIKNGCKSVRIPMVGNDVVPQKNTIDDLTKINFIYAGSHFKMDNIPMILKGLALLSANELKRISFKIYGIESNLVYSSLLANEIIALKNVIHVYGRCPHEEIMNAYKTSHFCIVLRDPNLRVNRAGFPSKVVECMKLGVPVICNYSSDLDKYLIDNYNSIIVKELTPEALAIIFRQTLLISDVKMKELRNNAISTVNHKLNISEFKEQFIDIIYNE